MRDASTTRWRRSVTSALLLLSSGGAAAVRLLHASTPAPLLRCGPPRCCDAVEAAAAALEPDVMEEDKSVKLVPMTTPLGFEEIDPAPGPPVPTLQEGPEDGRAVFVAVGLYKKGLTPSEPLTERYVQWLSAKEVNDNGKLVPAQPAPTVGLCRASYLNAHQSIGDEALEELGESVTEEELSALAAAEEEAEEEVGMLTTGAPFVLGTVAVLKAGSLDEADRWAQRDPHAACEAYESLEVHRWLRSDEPQLNLPAPGPCFSVYCRDKPGAAELRAATREAHLAWLKQGGRIHLGGALQSRDGEAGGNVGTLLVVNGDELDEVRAWAEEDPYAQAGLFASVVVAPLTHYALSAAGGRLVEL